MELEISRANFGCVDVQIPHAVQSDCWQKSQQQYTSANQWQGYLNDLCLRGCLPWLSSCFGVDSIGRATSYGELVEGAIVTIGRYRLCLLPHTSGDRYELRVPREWIEIPTWIADYYLPVQIDLDAVSASIWGYTTHLQIQQQGFYDDLDRMYSLTAQDSIQDISTLQSIASFSSQHYTRGIVSPTLPLSQAQIPGYLNDWHSDRLAIPRLEISEADFPHWLALLSDDDYRQQLINHRLGIYQFSTRAAA